ncbi:MAG: hypothetical protein CR991_07825 [Proteobacteria bacterium]|nr:MAG: hypothetical protein CR991_07825 [Pseudomonadota bacterium]
MLKMIPLFFVLLLAYFALCIVEFFPVYLHVVMLDLQLPSGVAWQPTYGDGFLGLGLLVLSMEIYKSTNTSDSSIIEHVLSTMVLVIYLVAWLVEPWAGNSYFAMLALMSIIDVTTGFTVSIAVARRDFQIGA